MSDPRAQYLADKVNTASPAVLLTMLYDRLLLDLHRAKRTLDGGEPAGPDLLHAQSIITELMTTLDQDAWDGAPRLLSIYSFVLRELIDANLHRDADKVASCITLLTPLAEAWHEAAQAVHPATHGAVGVA